MAKTGRLIKIRLYRFGLEAILLSLPLALDVIDELRIYDRSLSSQELQNLMAYMGEQTPSPSPSPSPTPDPTPTPSLEPSHPRTYPTPEPSITPTATPTPSPTPEPTIEPSPSPRQNQVPVPNLLLLLQWNQPLSQAPPSQLQVLPQFRSTSFPIGHLMKVPVVPPLTPSILATKLCSRMIFPGNQAFLDQACLWMGNDYVSASSVIPAIAQNRSVFLWVNSIASGSTNGTHGHQHLHLRESAACFPQSGWKVNGL